MIDFDIDIVLKIWYLSTLYVKTTFNTYVHVYLYACVYVLYTYVHTYVQKNR